MPEVDRDGEVFILNLGSSDNAFNPGWVSSVESALDEVESAAAPRALVTTATGKAWTTGLDLDWLRDHPAESVDFLRRVHLLFARVLSLGAPTVAAIQGHAFAAGAMLSLAHDYRIMRADRGYWCLPEVDIEIPFSAGMSALIQARLPTPTAHEAMISGRRYGGVEAREAGIVSAASPADEVLARALDLARALAAKHPATLSTIKERMHSATLEVLRSREPGDLVIPASS